MALSWHKPFYLKARCLFGLMKLAQMQGITSVNMDIHCVVKELQLIAFLAEENELNAIAVIIEGLLAFELTFLPRAPREIGRLRQTTVQSEEA